MLGLELLTGAILAGLLIGAATAAAPKPIPVRVRVRVRAKR